MNCLILYFTNIVRALKLIKLNFQIDVSQPSIKRNDFFTFCIQPVKQAKNRQKPSLNKVRNFCYEMSLAAVPCIFEDKLQS